MRGLGIGYCGFRRNWFSRSCQWRLSGYGRFTWHRRNNGRGGTSAIGGSPADTGGTNGADGGAPTCSGDPSADSCAISNQYGVFVSPNGSDITGDGTQGNQFQTLATALVEAKSRNLAVYACADTGSYVETLLIDAGLDGTRVRNLCLI